MHIHGREWLDGGFQSKSANAVSGKILDLFYAPGEKTSISKIIQPANTHRLHGDFFKLERNWEEYKKEKTMLFLIFPIYMFYFFIKKNSIVYVLLDLSWVVGYISKRYSEDKVIKIIKMDFLFSLIKWKNMSFEKRKFQIHLNLRKHISKGRTTMVRT